MLCLEAFDKAARVCVNVLAEATHDKIKHVCEGSHQASENKNNNA